MSPTAIADGLGTGLSIGAVAGVRPAMRAAGLAPAEALRTPWLDATEGLRLDE